MAQFDFVILCFSDCNYYYIKKINLLREKIYQAFEIIFLLNGHNLSASLSKAELLGSRSNNLILFFNYLIHYPYLRFLLESIVNFLHTIIFN